MLRLEFPDRVKYICAFIYAKENLYKKVKKKLTNKFGKIDFESKKINFDYTEYYYPEMGKPLFRRFVSFQTLKDPAKLIKIKLNCVKIEKKFSFKEKRSVNIDPGYINKSKLVLTTTKDFSHRIYLGKGVFAETTLFYQDGSFRDFPTTFPDYKTDLYKNIFEKIRSLYGRQKY